MMEVSYQNQEAPLNSDIPAVGGANSLPQSAPEEREARDAPAEDLQTPKKAQRPEDRDTPATADSASPDRDSSPGCPATDDAPATPPSQGTQP